MQSIQHSDTTPYLALDDATLDLIFGQAIARNVCDLPKAGNEPECMLYGDRHHYAPDDGSRPRPIEGGGAEFGEALIAARRTLGGSLEVVQHYTATGTLDVSVLLIDPDGEWHAAQAEAEGGGRAEDNARTMRRLIVASLLAAANAPTTVRHTEPTSLIPEGYR